MLFITTRRDTRMAQTSGFRSEEVAGISCTVAPIVFGAVTIAGFKEMFFRGCASPLLANAITACSVHEILVDGIWRLNQKQGHTVKDVLFSTINTLPNEQHDETPPQTGADPQYQDAGSIRRTVREIDIPGWMADLMADDTNEPTTIDRKTVVSFGFEFSAGRHNLIMTVNTLRVPHGLTGKPIETIAASIISATTEMIANHMETIANGYNDALRECREELLAIPAPDQLPKAVSKFMGTE
ncbi:hypothetical protein [Thalassospira sp. MCCC 1A03138]|uniref:hypothetical protein n=1 Tax=Thalassospira sp. MCCC 1A03138 TaxID=1470576 RepID=UPI00111BD8C4|nr:hypothetical protein [Thalassospira sp. MCCC 1A03138]